MKKKKLLKSSLIAFLISLGINMVLFIINMVCAYSFHTLPLAIEIPGGDCIEYIGFGVELLKLFALSIENEAIGSTYHISFEPMSILVPIIVVFIIVLTIIMIINKKKRTK